MPQVWNPALEVKEDLVGVWIAVAKVARGRKVSDTVEDFVEVQWISSTDLVASRCDSDLVADE